MRGAILSRNGVVLPPGETGWRNSRSSMPFGVYPWEQTADRLKQVPVMSDANDFDVLIVGGGMVGGVLAWSLGNSGLRVALVEQHSLDQAARSAGERSTALSWGSRQLLDAVGLWPALQATAAPIRRIHVSQQKHLGVVRMAAAEHNIDALGYVIRNAEVSRCLAQRLPELANVQIISSRQVASINQQAQSIDLTLSDDQQLNAKLLVIADGSDSVTRELAGISATWDDYEQQAIVTTLTTEGTPVNMAWERFTADGPMALLPLATGQLSLVYTVPQEQRESIMSLHDAAFIEAIQQSIGRRAGRILATSRRQAFPLRRARVDPSWQGRTVLLGNAARTLHPVAGQGFNLALRDAMTLAEQLQGLGIGQDAGADYLREQYLKNRQADQRETVGLTDALARGFRGRSSLLGHLRGAGIIATDRLPLLRRGFARRSMGLAHRVPKVVAPIV